MTALPFVLKRWPAFALAASAAMLATSYGFQHLGGLAPCHLCLEQRRAYWAALAVSAAAILLEQMPLRAPWMRIGSAALAAVFGWDAYVAGFQAGAEWKWWPAPVTCASNGPVSLTSLRSFLAGAGAHGPACDVAAWRFLGLSMAGWNFLISTALVLFSLASALRRETPK